MALSWKSDTFNSDIAFYILGLPSVKFLINIMDHSLAIGLFSSIFVKLKQSKRKLLSIMKSYATLLMWTRLLKNLIIDEIKSVNDSLVNNSSYSLTTLTFAP